MKLAGIAFRNLFRNKLRSSIVFFSVSVLVIIITVVWSVLIFLDQATGESKTRFKAIVTEKWSLPSQMPLRYASILSQAGASTNADDITPLDSMTWQFYAGSVDPNNQVPNGTVFAIATEPQKLLTMMDELDELRGAAKDNFAATVDTLSNNQQGIIIGQQRLRNLKRKVGDRIKLYGFSYYKGLDIEVEIVGVFPRGRYDSTAVMHKDFFNRVVDAYPLTHGGVEHPLVNRSLNAVWLKLPSADAIARVASQLDATGEFREPAVKVENVSAGVSTLLSAYNDLVSVLKWVLTPAILATLSLILANAVGIAMRERRKEIAVMRMIGFAPNSMIALVIFEFMLLAGGAAVLSSFATLFFVNKLVGGIAFPIAFFTKFYISSSAVLFAIACGVAATFVGVVWPAISTSYLRISEAFARVD